MKIKKINNNWLMRYLPWIAGAIALVLIVFTVFSSLVSAWGPERETFTVENPADRPVFNSMTNNPAHGDERNFTLIRDVESGEDLRDEIELQPGREYEVYMYFHNNAHERHNLGDGAGIARDVRMSVDMPQGIEPGERASITSTISASNTQPESVHDEAWITSGHDYSLYLRYHQASATINSNGAVNGATLGSQLFTPDGTMLGYTGLNGLVPGCLDYAGYVTFRFTAVSVDMDIMKQASPSGTNEWANEITANAGDEVDFQIRYENTGETDQNAVNIIDQLPEGMSYVEGSTSVVNSANRDGLSVDDGIATTENGINIGDYAPGGDAVVTFTARIDEDACGTLVNRAIAQTRNGSRDDTATVNVNNDSCEPIVPTELPTTGPAEVVAGILGLALVSLGIAYWIRSHNHYKRALAGFTHEVTDVPEEKLLTARTDTDPDDDKKTLF